MSTQSSNAPDPQQVADFVRSLIGSVVEGVGQITGAQHGRGTSMEVTTSDGGQHTANGSTTASGEPVVIFVPQQSSGPDPLLLVAGLVGGAFLLTR